MVNDRHYYFGTLVSWILRFAGRRYVDTYSARYCGDLCSRLAINWQKAMEITSILYLKSALGLQKSVKLLDN